MCRMNVGSFLFSFSFYICVCFITLACIYGWNMCVPCCKHYVCACTDLCSSSSLEQLTQTVTFVVLFTSSSSGGLVRLSQNKLLDWG